MSLRLHLRLLPEQPDFPMVIYMLTYYPHIKDITYTHFVSIVSYFASQIPSNCKDLQHTVHVCCYCLCVSSFVWQYAKQQLIIRVLFRLSERFTPANCSFIVRCVKCHFCPRGKATFPHTTHVGWWTDWIS